MDTIGYCSFSQASFPCSNSLDCPFPHVKHCPLHHIRVNLGNLPGDIGLQLVEGGRAWAADLGLEEAPESEVEGGTRSIPYSRKVIPNSTDNLIVFKSIQRERQSSQQQSASTHYEDFFLQLDSLLHMDLSKTQHGFLTNQSYICHS